MNENLRIAEEKFRKAVDLLSNKNTPFFEREALLSLEEAADLGHIESMFYLAKIYYMGWYSILKNTKKAMYFFEKSYKSGIEDALPYLINEFIIENKPNEIINKIDKLHIMVKHRNEYAASVMCYALTRFSNDELGINSEKRNLIIRDISLGNFPLDRVPYVRIKDK